MKRVEQCVSPLWCTGFVSRNEAAYVLKGGPGGSHFLGSGVRNLGSHSAFALTATSCITVRKTNIPQEFAEVKQFSLCANFSAKIYGLRDEDLADEGYCSKKNDGKKTLIPLPPTGSVSLFCANEQCGAKGARAQARRGVWRMFRNCTECKALQKSAVALQMRHWAAGERSRRRRARFTGTMISKNCCRECFSFRNRSYQGTINRYRTLRKNDCEAQPVWVSSIMRHCTA